MICQESPTGIYFGYHFETYFKSNNEQLLRFEFDALWGKLIRKSLIDKYSIRFDEVRYSNDTFFSAAIGVFAKKHMCRSRDSLYCHRAVWFADRRQNEDL